MPQNFSLALFLAAIVILTLSLIRHYHQRRKQEAKRAADRRAAALVAREAERKRLEMLGETPKVKLASGSRAMPDRVPLQEPFDMTFAGGAHPRNIAKWEAEIHQIGRQMIGQLDSKSVVLQTLTREANRAANRLEILIDHLESLLKSTDALQKPVFAMGQPNIIPREEAATAVEAFTDVLNELESELDQLCEPVEQSMSVLKAETMVAETADVPATSVPTPTDVRQPGLALSSLFDDNLVPMRNETTIKLAAVPSHQTSLIEQSIRPQTTMDRFMSDATAKLDTRSQVEMLDNYGYTPKQIAEDLNLTVEEVQLIISLKN